MKLEMAHDSEVVDIDLDTLTVYEGKCAFCKWFRPIYQRNNYPEKIGHWVDDEGWCVRFPPVFVGGEQAPDGDENDAGRFAQPGVSGSDECGEYVKGYKVIEE